MSASARLGTSPPLGASLASVAGWLGLTAAQVEEGCARKRSPDSPADEPTESGIPPTCVHDPTDSQIALDPDHTTFVTISIACERGRSIALALEWSDFGP